MDDALDAVPTQPVSFGFRSELRDRLVAEGLREAPEAAPAGRLHRMLRPLMTAAAAVLLVAVGYQLGNGGGNHATTIIDSDGAIADADLIDLYEMREVISAWELAEDAALEPAFAAMAQDEAWVEDLLDSDQE
ncbi:MAG: hypothetical protein CMJ94_03090 [Planctomycetes bacterium]|nr:hypothetical protein [Planctomycetota bacterium]